MDTIAPKTDLPEPLNAIELMWNVIAHTPVKLKRVRGVVNVDVRLTIDEHGDVTAIKAVRCNTLHGASVGKMMRKSSRLPNGL